ncbi:MAG: sigma 54-interacting transcriptional regulator [Myxococcota bacterium]|nr:sigma 54-interacting transcriptional regulator [Myxococcota bacterium]
MYEDETHTTQNALLWINATSAFPALLVAYAPLDATPHSDRAAISGRLRVGRDISNGLKLPDPDVSRRHLQITCNADVHQIEDLGSKNGTYLNGRRIHGPERLPDQAVIRLGQTILVFLKDARLLKYVLEDEKEFEEEQYYDIVGRFYAVPLLRELKEATIPNRSILLAGPSGSGKELAAHALAQIKYQRLTIQNAARFASEEEAMTTLFGVGPKVFSHVAARPGYIEQANRGILFLDEAHNLPQRVQKSLLRVMEDRQLARIGETTSREVNVLFVLASNEPPPTYALAHDLLARLRVVNIPSLGERLADIPCLFDYLLNKAFQNVTLPSSQSRDILNTVHYELLMLDRFETTNVRGLMEIAENIATRVAMGVNPKKAAEAIFYLRYGDAAYQNEAVQPAEQKTRAVPNDIDIVKAAYFRHGQNVSEIKRALGNEGLTYSRSRIASIIDALNLPRMKKTKK